MRGFAGLLIVLLVSVVAAVAADQMRLLQKVNPLPTALNDDFQIQKTKIFSMGRVTVTDTGARVGKKKAPDSSDQEPEATPTSTKKKAPDGTGNRLTAAIAEASLTFESRYRKFGAVTRYDERERSGDYFNFFWKSRRAANITVRFEYRQEKLHAFTQAREVDYPNARGNFETEFAIIGDDYYDDGRVISWRCVLVEDGKIVAEKRSYLWK